MAMNLRRLTASAGVAFLTVAGPVIGLTGGPAGADPTNAKSSFVFPIECEANGTLMIATNGRGRWTPGLVITNNQVGHPYELHSTGSFTPTDGGATEFFSDDFVKPAPRSGRLDVCTFHQEGTDEFGSFTVDGVAKISYTPAKS